MIGGFEDKVREGNAVAGEARGKVERLYPRKGEMDRLLSQDEDRFLAALTKATGSILQTGDDKAKPIRDFPEPIGAVARLYLKDLGLDEIAAELGIAEPKDLQSLILANPACSGWAWGCCSSRADGSRHGLGVVTIRQLPFPRGGEPTGAGDTAA